MSRATRSDATGQSSTRLEDYVSWWTVYNGVVMMFRTAAGFCSPIAGLNGLPRRSHGMVVTRVEDKMMKDASPSGPFAYLATVALSLLGTSTRRGSGISRPLRSSKTDCRPLHSRVALGSQHGHHPSDTSVMLHLGADWIRIPSSSWASCVSRSVAAWRSTLTLRHNQAASSSYLV